MQWLARVCVDRPVFTWVLSLTLLVVGVAALGGLPVDRFPNIDIPFITVVSPYPGASPEQVETEVTDIIEESVNSVAGLSELQSTSFEGLSLVMIQFELDKDVDVAAQEVRDRVDRVLAQLPESLDPPRVEKIDPDAAPLLYVALRGPGTPQELSVFAEDEVKARLEGKAGVGAINLLGTRDRQVRVEVDPGRLQAQGMSILDVRTALVRENLELPGGDMTQGSRTLQVRVPGRVRDAAQLAQVPVAQRNGHVVRLADVADVTDGAAEAESLASLNGEPVVLLTITRQSGTNAIAVADSIRGELDAIAADLPGGYTLDVVRDESSFPRTAVHAVQEHLILGAIFAILVVLSFLRNGPATIISALAIPVSIIATFAVIGALGLTLNMITLLALTLAVGIVIDDAIVVLENVIRFLEERQLDPREATIQATKDIGLAVLATTLSLVAVFLPVAFMGGIMGRFLASFGITMAVAVLVSLFVAFTLTPMLTARWLKAKGGHAHRPHPKERAPQMTSAQERARYAEWQKDRTGIEMPGAFYERAYTKLLAFSMRHRWVIGLAIVASFGSMAVVGPMLSTGFLPDDDEGRFEIVLEAPQGTSLGSTELLAERVARRVRELPEVDHTVVIVGANEGDVSGRGNHEALLYVSLVSDAHRDATQTDLMERVRTEIMPDFEGQIDATISKVAAFGGSGAQAAPIQYVLRGPDFDKLEEYSEALAASLRDEPGVAQSDTTFREGRPELRVELDRERAAELGVSIADIADTMRVLVGGLDVTELTLDNDQYDVNLRAQVDQRTRAEDLDRYHVRASNGSLVPLSQVAHLVEGMGPAAIEHIGRQRSVRVYANTLPGASTAALLQKLDRTAEALDMPSTYSTTLTGQAKEFGKAAAAFLTAIVLSFIFMYLVIAAQFESWLHPLTILASLPMTIPFAMISLLIFGQSLNVFSALGILVLFGIVKKNSILQVDHMIHLEKEGFSRPDAVMLANRDRLRPILMTTVAFVAGMAPLMVAGGAGSGMNRATAGVVLGGQSLALLLTLLATPVLYTWLGDLQRGTKRLIDGVKSRFGRGPAAEPTPEPAPAE
ncbi:MAG: efflux RND transporter permease subunit [Sandaracinus sp.]|nr:efflux RND transporter permease subunit [Sandaracinus sp.]